MPLVFDDLLDPFGLNVHPPLLDSVDLLADLAIGGLLDYLFGHLARLIETEAGTFINDN